jgi:hypothetical protein
MIITNGHRIAKFYVKRGGQLKPLKRVVAKHWNDSLMDNGLDRRFTIIWQQSLPDSGLTMTETVAAAEGLTQESE